MSPRPFRMLSPHQFHSKAAGCDEYVGMADAEGFAFDRLSTPVNNPLHCEHRSARPLRFDLPLPVKRESLLKFLDGRQIFIPRQSGPPAGGCGGPGGRGIYRAHSSSPPAARSSEQPVDLQGAQHGRLYTKPIFDPAVARTPGLPGLRRCQ
jgi:hypothetical protein